MALGEHNREYVDVLTACGRNTFGQRIDGSGRNTEPWTAVLPSYFAKLRLDNHCVKHLFFN